MERSTIVHPTNYMLSDVVTLPVSGISGKWEIERFVVSEFDALVSQLSSNHHEEMVKTILGHTPVLPLPVPPGQYVRLCWTDAANTRKVIMSTTPSEIRDHLQFSEKAYGDVLITGLGLGVIIWLLWANPKVNSVTVIELNKDVLKLSKKHYMILAKTFKKKLKIINADATGWVPDDEKFDCAWHDIWNDINDKNIDEMVSMKTRYQPHISGFQMCWSENHAVVFKKLIDKCMEAV